MIAHPYALAYFAIGAAFAASAVWVGAITFDEHAENRIGPDGSVEKVETRGLTEALVSLGLWLFAWPALAVFGLVVLPLLGVLSASRHRRAVRDGRAWTPSDDATEQE